MIKMELKKIISKNAKEVKKWPKWKQRIIVSANAFSTGKLLEEK